MASVFIVMGKTGKWDDRQEWMVIAYLYESMAQQHAANATRRAEELFATYLRKHFVEEGSNEFDPDMKMDFTGTSYFVRTVQLVAQEYLNGKVSQTT